MMQRHWTALAIVVLAGGLLWGCAPKAETPSPPPKTEIPATGELATPAPVTEETQIVIVIPEDPPSFDASIADTGYDALVMELALLGLAEIDPQGNVFPELAAELPTVENGGVVLDEEAGTMDVTWNLRSDVTWADGVPVTADDVVFTYEALIDPETGSWIQGIDYVDGIEKVDADTFVIHYNTVYPGYLTQFGGEQMVIWPAHYCDASQGYSQWECARKPLSDGPYILEEWDVGDHLTFVRNPSYYQQGKPAIDRIIVRIVPDASVRKTMLINGDVDLDMWTTEPVIAELKDLPNVKVAPSPTNRWVMRLFFNMAAKGTIDPAASPHPILSDVRVRQAIRKAIDVDTLSQEIFLGYAQPVWTEFFRPPYVCNIPRPVHDPKAAAALLEEAGWRDQDGDGTRECRGCQTASEGTPMEMELITYAEYGEPLELTQQLIAEMLAEIGIKANLTVMEGSVLWATYEEGGVEQSGNFDMTLWDDGYFGVDPSDFLWELYHSESAKPDNGWNISRWINEDFDTLLGETYTLDEEARAGLFCQIAEILDQQVPSLLLFTTVNADAHSARLQGVQSTTNDVVTWNAADWTVK